MVKVTSGGRSMGAIAAHLRYISKSGRLPIEDDRGVVRDGKDGVAGLVESDAMPAHGYQDAVPGASLQCDVVDAGRHAARSNT